MESISECPVGRLSRAKNFCVDALCWCWWFCWSGWRKDGPSKAAASEQRRPRRNQHRRLLSSGQHHDGEDNSDQNHQNHVLRSRTNLDYHQNHQNHQNHRQQNSDLAPTSPTEWKTIPLPWDASLSRCNFNTFQIQFSILPDAANFAQILPGASNPSPNCTCIIHVLFILVYILVVVEKIGRSKDGLICIIFPL